MNPKLIELQDLLGTLKADEADERYMPLPISLDKAYDGATLGGNAPNESALDDMPVDEMLAQIHKCQPEGAKPLALEDVYIIFGQAGSDRLIPDRFAFLDKTTLANVVDDMIAGVAMMSRHEVGRGAKPGTFPIGRTFTAKLTKDDDATAVVYGAYMLRGVKPNGDREPSTDELKRMIDAGQLFDNSLGLYGGTSICDVCKNDLWAYDPEKGFACPHIPGTTVEMNDAEIKRQMERNIPGGVATYTIYDAHAGEISAVYDGAIPGAGYRKTVALGVAYGDSRGRKDGSTMGTLAKLFGKPDDNANVVAQETVEQTEEAQVSATDESLQALQAENETLKAKLAELQGNILEQKAEQAVNRAMKFGFIPASAENAALKLARHDLEAFNALIECMKPFVSFEPSTDETKLDAEKVERIELGSDEDALIERARQLCADGKMEFHQAMKLVAQEAGARRE